MKETIETSYFRIPSCRKPLSNSGYNLNWQIEIAGKHIESILDDHVADYVTEYDDWGVSFCWTSVENIEHVIAIWTPYPDDTDCKIQIWATKCRIFWFRKNIPIEDSDLFALKPLLDNLHQKLSQSP